MTQSRYSKLSSLVVSLVVQQILPTGNGFGGSNLNISSEQELVLPVISSSISISGCNVPISTHTNQNSAPLVIEVGKIALLAGWFWCLIAVNFCSDRIVALANFCDRDS